MKRIYSKKIPYLIFMRKETDTKNLYNVVIKKFKLKVSIPFLFKLPNLNSLIQLRATKLITFSGAQIFILFFLISLSYLYHSFQKEVRHIEGESLPSQF